MVKEFMPTKVWVKRPPRISDFWKMYPSRYVIMGGMATTTVGMISSFCTRLTKGAKRILAPTLLITGALITVKGLYDASRGK